jgi:hypothetical protein
MDTRWNTIDDVTCKVISFNQEWEERMADKDRKENDLLAAKQAYIVVGVVAAAVSAATAVYIFWKRQHHLAPQVETVQDLLERCHAQVRSIEQRLGELNTV